MAAPDHVTPRFLAGWFRANRNFLLFTTLILMVALLPWLETNRAGEILFGAISTLLLIASVGASGTDRVFFRISLVLAGPAIVMLGIAQVSRLPHLLAASWALSATVIGSTIVCKLREIFGGGPTTRDRLFACANVYMLLGVLWCYLYALNEHVAPGAFSGLGPVMSLHVADLAYFSLNIVTSVGLTDVMPVSKGAKSLVLLQELASVLYMAFVISRLVGLYSPSAAEPT